jgi:hypothetical protein
MRYIKTYENFQVNEEIGLIGAAIGITLTAWILGVGKLIFRTFDTKEFNNKFEKTDEKEVIESIYEVEEMDYSKETEDEKKSSGFKKIWNTLQRTFFTKGTKIKKTIKEEYEFKIVKDKKTDHKFYAIIVDVVDTFHSADRRQPKNKKILVFNKEQFDNFKEECNSGKNPMKSLKDEKKLMDTDLKIYTPLQWQKI